jgi:alkanesulfonate monooxygenase SsuD/methylene tetrahydromethanopterin reductase-like flavin-dependent oxidoreductase (luciferase family)
MIGTGGARMLRLTAELADEWNAGMHLPDELPELIVKVDAACESVGRDPSTLPRSAEALIRTIEAADGGPAEEREIRGSPAEQAATLRRYAELGMSHVQVQLRPNRLEAVEAFAPVIEALARG